MPSETQPEGRECIDLETLGARCLGNVVVLLLFLGSWYLRYSAPQVPPYIPSTAALALSFIGFALAGVTGWLGGELVDRLSVGVDDGANLNAQSSLAGPATTRVKS